MEHDGGVVAVHGFGDGVVAMRYSVALSVEEEPASIGVMSRRAYIMNPWGAGFSAMARVSCHDVAERNAAAFQSGTRAS